MPIPSDPVASACAESGDGQLTFRVDQLCQQIQSLDRQIRQAALQSLSTLCDDPVADSKLLPPSPAQAIDIYTGVSLAVLRCYEDRFEQCRVLAAQAISSLLRRLPPNPYYPECLVPVIRRRIGQPEICEPSEEVRLQLVQQLQQIVELFAAKPEEVAAATAAGREPLTPCYNAIVDCLCKCLTDPYPAIPRQCCELIDRLALGCPTSFPARCDQLVPGLIAMLRYRQSATRVAAIRSLGTVAMAVTSSSEVVSRCIGSVSPLLQDDQAAVRQQCYRTGTMWLCGLRDRYSFFERLIPFALCGLHEPTEAGRLEVVALWRQCGDLYWRENEQELSKLEPAAQQPPVRYPEDVQRPTLGCRALVQRSLRICEILTREIRDWDERVQLSSLRLLWQVVLHAERAVHAKFAQFLAPCLQHYTIGEGRELREEAGRVGVLLGQLLQYGDWVEPALAGLRERPLLMRMALFAAMWTEVDAAEKMSHLRTVAEILADHRVCRDTAPRMQLVALQLAKVLVSMYGSQTELEPQLAMAKLSVADVAEVQPTADSVEQLLYNAIATIAARTKDDAVHTEAVALLTSLAAICAPKQEETVSSTLTPLDHLHSRCLPSLLGSLHADLDREHSDESSEPVAVLSGTIQLAGFAPPTLPAFTSAIRLCLQHGGHAARIEMLRACAVAMIGWHRTMGAESGAQLGPFVAAVVRPALTWKAGRNAGSVRTMATAVLRAAAQGGNVAEVPAVLADLGGQLWVTLVEDANAMTRHLAVECLGRCGPLPLGELRSVAVAVLGRLDDPSGKVRELAVTVLPRLRLQLVVVEVDGEEAEEADAARARALAECDSWKGVVKHLISTLLLHLDSPDEKMRPKVADAMIAIGREHRDVAESVLKDLPTAFYRKADVDSILARIEESG